jgi:hypothetical protein
MSDLAVAVFVTVGGNATSTVESIRASAEEAGARVDPLIVSMTGNKDPTTRATAGVLEFFPLGFGYAKNRLLESARAPAIAFLDDTVRVGPGWVMALLDAVARPDTAAVVGPVRPNESNSARSAETALAARALRGRAQASNVAVVCERALAVGGFPVRLEPVAARYEDLALIAALRRRGWKTEWIAALAVDRVTADAAVVDSAAARGYEIGRVIRHSRGRLMKPCVAAALREPSLASPATVPGLLRGLRGLKSWASPTAFLRLLPPSVSQRIDAEIKPLPASPPPKTHLMYDVGGLLLLHLHVAPSPRLRRSLAEREQIRARTGGIEGIPRLHTVQFETDAAWVLEDRLPGANPSSADAERWFAPVASWAVDLAGPPGPALGTVLEWRQHCAALIAGLPEYEESLLRSLKAVDEVASRHMHGDFQRRNVLLSDSSVGLVDWEGAWLYGIPGLDLVFLSLLARSDRPEGAVVAALLEGRDPEFGPLSLYLERAGAPGSLLRPLLVAMLATWALGEEQRIRRSWLPSQARPFRKLLAEFAPRATA